MRTRPLGTFHVTNVGFGDLCLARALARNVDGRDAARTLNEGLALGITLVDVADEEAAQQLAGETVRTQRLRDKVVTAYRIGELVPKFALGRREPAPRLLDALPIGYVQTRIEGILRITRLDALPLVQLPLLPAWLAASAWPDYVGACQRLVREGKVLHFGAHVADPVRADLEGTTALAAEPWLATVQVAYSLCDRTAEPLLDAAQAAADAPPTESVAPEPGGLAVGGSMSEVLSAALASPLADLAMRELAESASAAASGKPAGTPIPRAAILASRVLAGGTLGGEVAPGMKLALRDDRRGLDDAALAKIAEGIARLAPLVRQAPPAAAATELARGIVQRTRRPDDVEARTVGELAMRFALARGAVILPRLHRPAYLIEALAAATAPVLSPSLLERLDAIFAPPARDA